MKVLHVVEAWKGGIASYVESLIKDQQGRGYEVVLVADGVELNSDSRELGVTVIEYTASRNPAKMIGLARKLSKEIEKQKPDVVHCHSTFPGVYVRLSKHTCKVFYTPHAWSFLKKDIGPLRRCIYKFVERLMSRRCDKIICMSFEEIEAAHSIGLAYEKLSLVHTGIPSVATPLLAPCEINKKGPIKVGFFGRFDYQKGFDLIEGVVPLLNENIEMHLFGGFVRGSERPINPCFIDHGWIAHTEIHELMSEMDIILVPSRWEGFALTPLEAMRAGLPVVVSNSTSLSEAVIHGFNGIILAGSTPLDLATALHSLTREECRRMGGNASRVYEQTFNFDTFSNRMNSIYLS